MCEIQIREPVTGAAVRFLEFSFVAVACAVVDIEGVEVPVGKQIGFVADELVVHALGDARGGEVSVPNSDLAHHAREKVCRC